MRQKRLGLAWWVMVAGLLAQPVTAGADEYGSSFDRFCGAWMKKLEEREVRNIQNIRYSPGKGGAMVGEYTGYARTPLRCLAKATRSKVSPSVGTLVYHEIRYRKAGKSAAEAQRSRPEALERVEVMEIFRYDGSRWIY